MRLEVKVDVKSRLVLKEQKPEKDYPMRRLDARRTLNEKAVYSTMESPEIWPMVAPKGEVGSSSSSDALSLVVQLSAVMWKGLGGLRS